MKDLKIGQTVVIAYGPKDKIDWHTEVLKNQKSELQLTKDADRRKELMFTIKKHETAIKRLQDELKNPPKSGPDMFHEAKTPQERERIWKGLDDKGREEVKRKSATAARKPEAVESFTFKGVDCEIYKTKKGFEYDFPGFSQGGPQGGFAHTQKEAVSLAKKDIRYYLESQETTAITAAPLATTDDKGKDVIVHAGQVLFLVGDGLKIPVRVVSTRSTGFKDTINVEVLKKNKKPEQE